MFALAKLLLLMASHDMAKQIVNVIKVEGRRKRFGTNLTMSTLAYIEACVSWALETFAAERHRKLEMYTFHFRLNFNRTVWHFVLSVGRD